MMTDKRAPEGAPDETPAEFQLRLKTFLADIHVGETCPRDPAAQFAAPGHWMRRMQTHINVGNGVHLYVHLYTCVHCDVSCTVESQSGGRS